MFSAGGATGVVVVLGANSSGFVEMSCLNIGTNLVPGVILYVRSVVEPFLAWYSTGGML